ncbi:MAG: hypothetical protein ACK5Q5_11940 [Planctomycetaceae bacterium]
MGIHPTIRTIERELRKYPSVRYSATNDHIQVEPVDNDGFTVWLTVRQSGLTVGFDGWREDFADETEAWSAFAFGLSDRCRLKVVKRGNTECSWTLEYRDEEGHWTRDSVTALVFAPFWRRKVVVYRQNRSLVEDRLGPTGD